MQTARFYQLPTEGSLEHLVLVELPIPEPKEGEIRLRVEAIALNRAETMYQHGYYFYLPLPGSIPGYEAAGVVDAVGSGVTTLAVGDRVSTVPAFSMREYGVYGEYAIVPAFAAVRYPAHLSVAEAAAVWMQYLTAYGALVHYGQVKKGDYVLITAAAGGVGIAAIQLAHQAGATTIAVTRRESKRAFLESLGADHVIVLETEDLAARVAQITAGHGADLVFDPVGGPQFAKLAEGAAAGAQVILYGGMAPNVLTTTDFPLLSSLSKGLVLRGYTLFELSHWPAKFSQYPFYDPIAYPKAIADILAGLESGVLKPVLDKEFPFEQLSEAQQYFQGNPQGGKVIVKVS